MNRLNFSHNWNSKLDCDCFSTIRLYNAAVHFIGREVKIYDNSTTPARFKGYGVYMVCEPFKLSQLKPAAAMLDTGYSLDETRNIIRTMYKNKVKDIETESLVYIVVKKIKPVEKQQKLM